MNRQEVHFCQAGTRARRVFCAHCQAFSEDVITKAFAVSSVRVTRTYTPQTINPGPTLLKLLPDNFSGHTSICVASSV